MIPFLTRQITSRCPAPQFDGVSWQRCWTHSMRNALAKTGHRHKDALARELSAARKPDDVRTCPAEAERIAERWEKDYPRLATQTREQFEQTLAVHELPKEHRRRMYTTNTMERLMREVRRRTHSVGIFPHQASCDRLVGANLLERHESWQCERTRHLLLDHLDRRRQPREGEAKGPGKRREPRENL